MRWARGKSAAEIKAAYLGKQKPMTKRELLDRAVGELRAAEKKGLNVSSIRLTLDGEALRLMSLLNTLPPPRSSQRRNRRKDR